MQIEAKRLSITKLYPKKNFFLFFKNIILLIVKNSNLQKLRLFFSTTCCLFIVIIYHRFMYIKILFEKYTHFSIYIGCDRKKKPYFQNVKCVQYIYVYLLTICYTEDPEPAAKQNFTILSQLFDNILQRIVNIHIHTSMHSLHTITPHVNIYVISLFHKTRKNCRKIEVL